MRKLKKMVNAPAASTEQRAPRSPSPDETSQGGLTKFAKVRIQQDLADFQTSPDYTFEQIDPKDITKFKLVIKPQEGIYEGGKWEFSFDCPPDFPNNPPKVHCLTQIYHPNIDLEGHVCLSTLRVDKDWSPVTTLNHVVYGILSLFLYPNPDDPLNVEAGQAMKSNEAEFTRTVRKTMKGGRFFGKDFPRLI